MTIKNTLSLRLGAGKETLEYSYEEHLYAAKPIIVRIHGALRGVDHGGKMITFDLIGCGTTSEEALNDALNQLNK
jgi:hypothetical protein